MLGKSFYNEYNDDKEFLHIGANIEHKQKKNW